MSAEHRVTIKLDIRPDTPAGWLAKGKAVDAAASANAATFSSISALLAQLGDDSQLLNQVQARAANRGKIGITARNSQWRVLQRSLRAFAAGVQGLCDVAPDADHAKAIAAAAGLDAKLSPVLIKPDFAAKPLGSGAVRLYGRRPVPRRQAFYEWQMSTDGGASWTPIATTNNARTLVQGLTRAATISFRYRKTVMNVPSEWSQAIAVLVH